MYAELIVRIVQFGYNIIYYTTNIFSRVPHNKLSGLEPPRAKGYDFNFKTKSYYLNTDDIIID